MVQPHTTLGIRLCERLELLVQSTHSYKRVMALVVVEAERTR